jgi:hypothetical protein
MNSSADVQPLEECNGRLVALLDGELRGCDLAAVTSRIFGEVCRDPGGSFYSPVKAPPE